LQAKNDATALIGDHPGVPGIRDGLPQDGRAAPRPPHFIADSGCAKHDLCAHYTPFIIKLTFKFDPRLRLDQNRTSGLRRSGRVR
jgi:hypothetical protein